MATGVKTREYDQDLNKIDFELLEDAFKKQEFRKMFADYVDEIRDPANQAIYQKEMTQLEKERGYDIKFINPKPGYVIKTSVAGDRKAFINICSSDTVAKPSCSVNEVNGTRGLDWQIPYSLIPPREDFIKNDPKTRCVIYDVVFHPDTIRLGDNNLRFRDLVNDTAFDALHKAYNVDLDKRNSRRPKAVYKGMVTPAVIRKEDPDYKPGLPDEDGNESFTPEMIEKLYPQRTCSEPLPQEILNNNIVEEKLRKNVNEKYTTPKYVVKHQKNVDFQDYTYNRDDQQHSATPSHLAVEINLPLISSTSDCILDVKDKKLKLVCEKPAKYKLDIKLPYAVDDDRGKAKFDKTKRLLTVTLPVKVNYESVYISNIADSGVDSEDNTSQSDEDATKEGVVVEISSNHIPEVVTEEQHVVPQDQTFLSSSLSYTFPSYTHNILDSTVAFTFHVKNADPNSIIVKAETNRVWIKFTSVGGGFVPIHYASLIVFDERVIIEEASGEGWDNNVILQLEMSTTPRKYQIGLNEDSLNMESFGPPIELKKESTTLNAASEPSPPLVEVANYGNEINISVMSHDSGSESVSSHGVSPRKDKVSWSDFSSSEGSAKGILRKHHKHLSRSLSESSVGDIASSVDYVSSDCIPEESSLKKTVRFNDCVARQFYRHNSSIEGQKKKNQRKKSKKRNLERRKSESEAEDETRPQETNIYHIPNKDKLKEKPTPKHRRDSGLADTSDAEDTRTDKRSSAVVQTPKERRDSGVTETSEAEDVKENAGPTEELNSNIPKHTTPFYDPNKLNKGRYLEVNFKNDLIFDLDM